MKPIDFDAFRLVLENGPKVEYDDDVDDDEKEEDEKDDAHEDMMRTTMTRMTLTVIVRVMMLLTTYLSGGLSLDHRRLRLIRL
jgi:hypothetical protein